MLDGRGAKGVILRLESGRWLLDLFFGLLIVFWMMLFGWILFNYEAGLGVGRSLGGSVGVVGKKSSAVTKLILIINDVDDEEF